MLDKEYDLHNLKITNAEELDYFLNMILIEAHAEGFNLIRIITGRGLNSKNRPLLKPLTEKFIKHSPLVSKYKLSESLGAFEIWLAN